MRRATTNLDRSQRKVHVRKASLTSVAVRMAEWSKKQCFLAIESPTTRAGQFFFGGSGSFSRKLPISAINFCPALVVGFFWLLVALGRQTGHHGNACFTSCIWHGRRALYHVRALALLHKGSLTRDSGARACSWPLPAQKPLAEVIFWSLKTMTLHWPLTQARAVMVTRVRVKLASVT